MAIDKQEKRQRWITVGESLRKLSLERFLPLDLFYASGDINPWQWDAGHIFRAERVALLEARAKASPTKSGSLHGFSMATAGIERAMRLEWQMSAQYFEWALALIGEKMIDIEIPQAQRVTVWLGEFYNIRPKYDKHLIASQCGLG